MSSRSPAVERIFDWDPKELSPFESPDDEEKQEGTPPAVDLVIKEINYGDARQPIRVTANIPAGASRDNTKLRFKSEKYDPLELIPPYKISPTTLYFKCPNVQAGSFDVLVECDGQDSGTWYTLDIAPRGTEESRRLEIVPRRTKKRRRETYECFETKRQCEMRARFRIQRLGTAFATPGSVLVVLCDNLPIGACEENTECQFDFPIFELEYGFSKWVRAFEVDHTKGLLSFVVPDGLKVGSYNIAVKVGDETSSCASKLEIVHLLGDHHVDDAIAQLFTPDEDELQSIEIDVGTVQVEDTSEPGKRFVWVNEAPEHGQCGFRC